jgi:arylsulfatase A-like enzyme
VTEANRTCDAPVSLLDIYPTLVELCGLPETPQELEGKSLVPLLRDPAQKWEDRGILTSLWRGQHTVRDGRWRYIRYRDGGEELRDHDNDPHEWSNLAVEETRDQYADVIKRLAKWMPETEVEPAIQGLRRKWKREREERDKQAGD